VIFPLDGPNGLGLSPEGDRIYVAETYSARVWWWEVTGPGQVTEVPGPLPHGGTYLAGLPGLVGLDSLAVDAEGNVCVATLLAGTITSIAPDGSVVDSVEAGDPLVTNVAFGGDDLRTAYLTLSGTGRLGATDWPRPGLKLAHP
jgi:gluconolactonase